MKKNYLLNLILILIILFLITVIFIIKNKNEVPKIEKEIKQNITSIDSSPENSTTEYTIDELLEHYNSRQGELYQVYKVYDSTFNFLSMDKYKTFIVDGESKENVIVIKYLSNNNKFKKTLDSSKAFFLAIDKYNNSYSTYYHSQESDIPYEYELVLFSDETDLTKQDYLLLRAIDPVFKEKSSMLFEILTEEEHFNKPQENIYDKYDIEPIDQDKNINEELNRVIKEQTEKIKLENNK